MRIIFALVALTACSLDVDYTGTYYACGPNGECPDGYLCVQQVCIPAEPDPTTCSSLIAAGGSHTCITRSGDGSVWCWGRNSDGQLGNASGIDSSVPVQVVDLTNVTALTAGQAHTCALSAGDVFCWGENGEGQLGDGRTSDSNTPVQVQNVSGVTAISAGFDYTCAIGTGRIVSCWGGNGFGQLGDGTTNQRGLAAPVSGSLTADVLVVGNDTSCAVSGGVLFCWGENESGQMMNGMMGGGPVRTPTAAIGLPAVATVGVGFDNLCVVTTAGEVFCAGTNNDGELGNGLATDSIVPVRAGITANVVGIAASDDMVCAYDAAGASWCWGRNSDNRLSIDGDTQFYPVATTFDPVDTIVTGTDHTCVREKTGAIACVGYNGFGQLGNTERVSRGAPQTVEGLTDVSSIASGGGFSCAVDSAGTAKCWGDGDSGQLGTGGFGEVPTPVPVGLTGIAKIVGGGGHACALMTDQTVQCWGFNGSGQLGDGTNASRGTPLPVRDLGGAATQLALGDDHSCALVDVAGVAVIKCWGFNGQGRLGDGTTNNSNVPVQATLTNVAAVAAGGGHTCAIDSMQRVQCWGLGTSGQLGNLAILSSTTAVTVVDGSNTAITGVVEVQARGPRTFARLANGTAVGWGYGCDGVIGSAMAICSATDRAVALDSLTSIKTLAAGYSASCALKTDGAVFCWGPNYVGQVGDGTYESTGTPVLITGLAANDIASGGDHVCAVRSDRTVACWGYGGDGQLGDGVLAVSRPTSVRLTCQ